MNFNERVRLFIHMGFSYLNEKRLIKVSIIKMHVAIHLCQPKACN